jgi:hypothetical protein
MMSVFVVFVPSELATCSNECENATAAAPLVGTFRHGPTQ